MTYTIEEPRGFDSAPKVIRYLIVITACMSLICALLNPLFTDYLGIQSPQFLFSLSNYGLSQGYIWQPISFLFLQSSGTHGFSIPFLIELLFNMYILWVMGSTILERVGTSAFLRFYFICGMASGLTTLLLAPNFAWHTVLAGSSPAITAIIMVWTMLYPEVDLLLFFFFRIKAKWLLFGVFCFIILVNLSRLDFVHLIFNLSGLFFGYCYGAAVWSLEGPFSLMRPSDYILRKCGSLFRSLSTKFQSKKIDVDRNLKVFDIHTGEAVIDDDDVFMDKILDKISKHGEKSLTWSERSRLKKISQKKSGK